MEVDDYGGIVRGEEVNEDIKKTFIISIIIFGFKKLFIFFPFDLHT